MKAWLKTLLDTSVFLRWLLALPRNSQDSFIAHSRYSFERRMLFGLSGSAGFISYGLIWTYVYPQPYENMPLRIFFSIAWLIFAFLDYWPNKIRTIELPYWWALSLLSLPFFFSFMLLMNGFNPVWSMSLIAEMVILVLLTDFKNFIFHHLIGSLLAYVAYLMVSDNSLWFSHNHISIGELIFIVLFTLIGVLVFNLSELITATRSESTIHVGQRMAHELRTPLLSIINYSGRIRSRNTQNDDSPDISDLSMIEKEAQHCFLSLELFLASANPTPPIIGDLFIPLSKTIQESISATARHQGQEDWFKTNKIGDIHIKTPENILRHVFDNLLTNAIYAVQKAERCESGRIHILINSPDHCIQITDNGSGISKTHQTRIFEPFFTTKHTGTGLGLPYCKDVIEALGGRLESKSNLEEGTCFSIYLPKNTPHIRFIGDY